MGKGLFMAPLLYMRGGEERNIPNEILSGRRAIEWAARLTV